MGSVEYLLKDDPRTDGGRHRLSPADSSMILSRSRFMSEAQRRLQAAPDPVLVTLVDLGRALRVSFRYGWGAGARLLDAASARLRRYFGEDALLGRLGDGIYGVLASGIADRAEAARRLELLVRGFAVPLEGEGHVAYLTVAAGAALFPGDGLEPRELLLKAEGAMAQARRAGRSKWCLHEIHGPAGEEDDPAVEAALARAVPGGELVLHYQPYMDTVTGRPTGAEALVRWNHPQLGLLPPDRFVPLAEEVGLIDDIGVWVLQEACRQACAWGREGLSALSVAVNVSAVQFSKGTVAPAVARALAASGLDPARLELEITESTVMHDVQSAIKTLRELKSMGVTLSVDDFGTGHSSLSYLSRFPLDILKVDRSFVRDIGVDAEDEAIVRAVIGLAKTLDLRVTAEGVETAQQLRFLLREGCDRIQGYLFSRPVAADALARFVRESVWKEAF